MAAHALFSVPGVFALLQAYAFLQYLKDRLTRQEFQTLFFLGVSLAAGLVFLTVIYLTYTGMDRWEQHIIVYQVFYFLSRGHFIEVLWYVDAFQKDS